MLSSATIAHSHRPHFLLNALSVRICYTALCSWKKVDKEGSYGPTGVHGSFHHRSSVGSHVCKGIIIDPPCPENKLLIFLLFLSLFNEPLT